MAVLLEADGQVRLAGAVARVAEHLVQHQLFVDARLQSQDILITSCTPTVFYTDLVLLLEIGRS